MNYEFLEHTADVKFRAYGDSFEEALANAAVAVTDVVTDVSKVKESRHYAVIFESEDREAMVYDFLSHVVALMDGDRFLTARAEVSIDGNTVHATLYGDGMDPYEIHSDVKAMTYSDLLIEESKGGFMLQVVLDI